MSKNPTPNTVNDNYIDIDLSATSRKKIRFDNDDSRIVELNLSDMNMVRRIRETYPKLRNLQEKAGKITEGLNEHDNEDDEFSDVSLDEIGIMSDRLNAIDKEMRELIDYMFDAPVSNAAAPDGSMYDPFGGSFRYEYIITILMGQYSDNIESEFSKMEKQVKSHTDKYTKKRK